MYLPGPVYWLKRTLMASQALVAVGATVATEVKVEKSSGSVMTPTIKKANTLNTYAQEWNGITPNDSTEVGIDNLPSRTGGMSIAYSGEQLMVKSEENPHIVVSVYTASGALAMRQGLRLEEGHERLGVSMLPAGIYIARAKDSDGNECATKFAKK